PDLLHLRRARRLQRVDAVEHRGCPDDRRRSRAPRRVRLGAVRQPGPMFGRRPQRCRGVPPAAVHLRNLTEAKADVKPVWQSLRHADTWIMSLLYIGTFGSFIGYSAAFPTLLKTVFGRGDIALGWAFLGAGIGSLVRPLGGKLADRIGGARITAASFVMLAAGAAAALWSVQSVNLPVFFVSFMFLFVATGIGNGSSYRMISRIFQVKGEVAGGDPETMVNMRRQAAGALGIISSIGAFGGFVVPLAYAWSKVHFGNIEPALHFYVAFFLALLVVTWYCYLRRTTPMGQVGV
ncbi:LOW QUALITY PROTEIN: integral membrane nitrite extrusion protein naru, partial [Mycobacterium tuberculosis variant africanum K85]